MGIRHTKAPNPSRLSKTWQSLKHPKNSLIPLKHDHAHICTITMLRDYVVELHSTNPNTTVKISIERNYIQRIYVCLGALKLGFRAFRRELLGLDGAFIKGPFPCQVLVAVGLDSNNGIYSLVYALVEAKSKAKSDLLLNNICERIANVQSVIGKSIGPLTPTATRIMESIKKKAHLMKVQWNGGIKYQVSKLFGDQCVVDVMAMPCSCRKWELTEMICKHVVSRPKKKRKRSKHEDEPFVKDGKLSKKGRTITRQSCGNIRHNKATCKGQGGNNAEASGSASSQPSTNSQVSVTETRNADGREMCDGIPTQSNAAGGASEWSVL
ncbi:retrotransposon-related protein [Tanacetum coccineum]